MMHAETDRLVFEDELTGAYNRRFLTQLFEERWDELRRESGRVSVVIVDLDAFKEVNDLHGHLTGDDFLRATAAILATHFRHDDYLIRYGGDEFVIVAPGVSKAEVDALAERARSAGDVYRPVARDSGEPIDATVRFSVGVATCPDDGSTGEELLTVADQRLYDDKARRRRDRAGFRLHPAIVATLIALVIVIIAAAAFEIGGSRRVVPQPPPVTTLPLQEPTPDPAVIVMLRQQIENLQAERERLLDEPGPTTPAQDVESQRVVEEMRLQMAELQRRLDDVEPAPVPAATPTPAVLATPVPVATPPPVSVSQTTPVERSVAPLLVRKAPPAYPRIARTVGREARVDVRVVIDERGRVVEAEALNDAGYGFEAAAERAARRSDFQPGTIGGIPQRMATTITYEFRLPTR